MKKQLSIDHEYLRSIKEELDFALRAAVRKIQGTSNVADITLKITLEEEDGIMVTNGMESFLAPIKASVTVNTKEKVIDEKLAVPNISVFLDINGEYLRMTDDQMEFSDMEEEGDD